MAASFRVFALVNRFSVGLLRSAVQTSAETAECHAGSAVMAGIGPMRLGWAVAGWAHEPSHL
ncbi:hypothetical protein AB4Y77_06880 [Paenarthrobacter sp. YAF11_1]|uniref:hypothetical protein n=1 Tax=Paenarthrobacter sp. YAF11_1 TaxID=3233074 RepID=UPI003F98DF77